jgi:hypothetical protein
MHFLLLIWLALATAFWGLPTYLYGTGRVTFIDRPVSHSAWFLLGIAITIATFNEKFVAYFADVSASFVLLILLVLAMWLLSPLLLPRDHLTFVERLKYQPTKFIEVFLQQVLFLAGLLIFNENWILFGLLFFAVHLPFFFFLPLRIISVTASASLPGGFLFAYLQSFGPIGFVASLGLHMLFYACFNIALASGLIPTLTPYRR